jgi:NAD(P)-dependent dehydrogenase (short-subunit alcohol dehydrogenase family)
MATRALVVGGTSGIGYAIACRIAAESAFSSVIISGRKKPKTTIPHANIRFQPLDASSLRSIKQYTDAYKSAYEQSLDLLVLTQGIMTTAGRTETPEGIDYKMALHYYGRQLLIRELLPALKDNAKVLVVLDGREGSPTKLNWEDLDLKTHFSLGTAADHCISMNDAMVQVHASQKGNRRHFVHAYPGRVKTDLWSTLPWYLRAPMQPLSHVLCVSPETCAENLLKGTEECPAMVEKEGKFWSCIDGKGRLVPNKPSWSEDELRRVADHTWKLVDDTLSIA